MESLIKDIRFGMRGLMQRPGFTAVAVITLALGIGANSAIFSVVNAVLLRPLPFKDPDRLMVLWERRENSGRANLHLSGHEYAAFKERTSVFEALTLIQPNGYNLTGKGDPVVVDCQTISWMPATLDIHPWRYRVEPGVNLTLEQAQQVQATNFPARAGGPCGLAVTGSRIGPTRRMCCQSGRADRADRAGAARRQCRASTD